MSESFEYLGPYRVGELLGRGGMGNVYSGQHVKTGENVAVKVISPAISEEARFRRRFATEIEALRLLSHPAIVKLIGYGEEEGVLFYSMELIQGETLQKVIRREKRLPWPMVIELAIRICSGLKHAHDIGVTHRDLKPANLILTGKEESPIKIVDFGIPKIWRLDSPGDKAYAKSILSALESSPSEQTSTGSILGTPDYMAPEQANGGKINAKTDLYCLGSTMYAALSGRPPFRGKNVTDVITKLKREEPPDLRELNLEADLPHELLELITELLRKDPNTRPPTALVVMNRLKGMRDTLRSAGTMVDSSKTILPGPSDGNDHAATLATGQQSSEHDVTFAVDQQIAKNLSQASDQTILDTAHQKEASKKEIDPRSNPSVVHRSPQREATNSSRFSTDEPTSEQKTHFATVGDDPARNRVFDETGPSRSAIARWLPGLGLFAIAAALVGIVLMQLNAGPDADGLYATAMQNRDQDAAKIFLREYPDDNRFAEVESMLMNDRLESMVRRYKTRKRIGASPLEPHEDSFLDAGMLWAEGASDAGDAFARWLSLFEGDVQADSELIELASFFEGRKNLSGVESEDTRIGPLRDKMEGWRNLPVSKQISQLTDLVTTFEGKSWASPIVNDARVRLSELQKAESQREGGEISVSPTAQDSP